MNTTIGWMRTRLRAALGDRAVEEGEAGLRVRAVDRAAVHRTMEIALAQRCSIVPVGGGRRSDHVVFGGATEPPLRVHAPRGLMDLWPEDLVARFGAGTTLSEAHSVLARHGLCLDWSASHPEQATLGGVYASGDRGLSGRAPREDVLGLTAVDGAARLLRAGARVVKNVAGYDLTRLFHGSRGSLGILVDLVVRLRVPAASRRARVGAGSVHDLVRVWSERRRERAVDTRSELLLGPRAGAHGGGANALGPCHLVEVREGAEEDVLRWARAGEAWGLVPREDPIPALLDALWAPGAAVERWQIRLTDWLAVADRFPGFWIADLKAAEVWVRRPEGARLVAPSSARVWDERPMVLGAESALPAPVRHLRGVFDPRGVLPSAPASRPAPGRSS